MNGHGQRLADSPAVRDGLIMFAHVFVSGALFLSAAAGSLPTARIVAQAQVTSGDLKKGPVFGIGIGACSKAKGTPRDAPADCGVFVELKRGGSGRHKLEWQAKAGPVTKPNDNSVVVADPSDEEQTLLVRWRPITVGNVNLKAGVDGLLVTQEERRGDRVRRRYDVFLARKNKLVHAFTAQEGRGARSWSSMDAVDIDHDGGNELLFFSSTTPDESQADRFEMQMYSWRADVAKMVARNDLRPAVKGAVIGMFKTIEAARAMQASACADTFLVLDQSSADKLADHQVVLAWPAVTTSDAELALEGIKTCNPALVGAVKTMTGGVDIDADQDQ